jgi:hypothetical protein
LQDIAGDRLHPEIGETYATLWQRMAPNAPCLDIYPMQFQ